MTDREAIITKIESLLDDAPVTDWVGGGVLADTRGLARNIVAVFEKAHTPTDDERVLAALSAYYAPDGHPERTLSDWSEGSVRSMRAALRAASEAGGEGR